ncbi:hypothetical protein, partial [Janthinobacterium sp. PC23-8]|uniref:hypothetical protein n=1 Tax=Janthinobacterium sp. PC23-8 TaxID=2012679 RepID=UPI001C3E6A36
YSVLRFALSTKRCVCQLRRRKIMKHLSYFVNPVFQRIALKNFLYLTQHLHASFSEGANYSPGLEGLQGLFSSGVNIAV